MSDRPGALAALAQACGARDANILGLQIFPGVAGVTDELVLRSPDGWGIAEVAELVEGAGGEQVSVGPCTEHALVDGPTHYLRALAALAGDAPVSPDRSSGRLAGLLADLLDAEPGPAPGEPDPGLSAVQDTLAVQVGPQQVALRRTTPFTDTERARAAAFAEVATHLATVEEPGAYETVVHKTAAATLAATTAAATTAGDTGGQPGMPPGDARPVVRLAGFADTPALVRMHQRCSADSVYRRYATPLSRIDERFARRLLLSGGGAVVAAVDGPGEGEIVAIASVAGCEAGVAEVALLVEDGWQRRGLGTRLLSAAARLARGQGATEMVLRSRTHNPALMPLAFSSGLRARIRLDGDSVVVTVGIGSLAPLTAVPGPIGGSESPRPAPIPS